MLRGTQQISSIDEGKPPVTQGDKEVGDQSLGAETPGKNPVNQVLGFFQAMPTVSKEVALKIAEQLPEVRRIATKALSGLERSHKNTLDANTQSQEHVHAAYQDIRDVLKGELKADDLQWDQKKEIYDLLMETGKEQAVKDTENKRALDTWLKAAGVVAVAALAVSVALVGAKYTDEA